jgi:hypothetical protein
MPCRQHLLLYDAVCPKGIRKLNTVNAFVKSFYHPTYSPILAEPKLYPMTLRITIFLVVLLTLSQCKKKKPEDQPPSYAFSCTVNGQSWIASTPLTIGGPASLTVDYHPNTGDFSVTARRKDIDNSYFELVNFYAPAVISTGDYSMYTGDGEFQAFGDYLDNYSCGIYYHDTSNPGALHISSIDTVNRRIKGEFTFTAINADCGSDSLLIIENGYFNLRY